MNIRYIGEHQVPSYEAGHIMTDDECEAAHAATEVGADQPRIPRDRDMRVITGLLVSLAATGGVIVLGAIIAAVWPA